MRLSLGRCRPLCFVAACAVALAGFATFAPGRLATATDETFFGVNLTVPAPCSVAHCSPWLNGQEQGGGGQMLSAAVGDAPITTTVFTPTPPIAFNGGMIVGALLH